MLGKKELIIIGNGFDLSCGLASRYSDFFEYRYPEFKSNTFQKKFEETLDLWKNIRNINGRISAIEDDLKALNGAIVQDKTTIKIEELMSELKDRISQRQDLFIKFYSSINKTIFSKNLTFWDYMFMFRSNENKEKILWCDVETEILKMLSELMDSYDKFEKNRNLPTDALLYENDLSKLLFMYFNSNKFVNSHETILNYEELLKIYRSSNIYEILLVELNKFELAFNAYIKEKSYNNRMYIKAAERLFQEISKGTKDNYILNFNYTNPLNSVSKENIYQVNNIHGNLDTGEIIFGIDSFDELESPIIIFTKTNRIISLADRNSQPIPIKEITNSISFFGHSLSSADYSYFLSLFDFYDIYNSHVKLRFCYRNFSPTAKKDLLQNITNLMTKYGESFDNKAKGRNLMHKLSLENRIIVEEIE
ncbi:hypothetical protein JZO80_13925 [Vagococcus fluvialis]|uniref:AbiH family protein n=1 Tax=Vagococcus fluvialis TaxID=2738 RepID=UPI000A3331AB|nr:AbiH family protein [Vagococcus fluvialis]MBO0421259.1 hypothetical protein [Vagococcus fluvialis]OTP33288.1 hypothetical protein A5798_000017 [Enterococcus sp. 6C8_DIV0013]